MSIQSRIEELAAELKASTGKRPRRVLMSEDTFKQWKSEMETSSGMDAGSFDQMQMGSVRAHALGVQLEFAASDCELEVE